MALQQAKKELKDAWIPGEGYDYDQTYIVCYSDGTVLDTRETNTRLPLRNIIGIQFCGSDGSYAAGQEIHNGQLINIKN